MKVEDWIPVEKELPPPNVWEVLAYHPKFGSRTAYYKWGHWWWVCNSDFREDPTHWMYLPPKPNN